MGFRKYEQHCKYYLKEENLTYSLREQVLQHSNKGSWELMSNKANHQQKTVRCACRTLSVFTLKQGGSYQSCVTIRLSTH